MTRIGLPSVIRTADAQAHPFPIQIAYQTQEFIQGFMFHATFSDLAVGHIVRLPGGIGLIEKMMRDKGLSEGVVEQGWKIMGKYMQVFQGAVYQAALISLNSHWDWYIRKLSEFIEFCRSSVGGPAVSAKDQKRLSRASRLPLLVQIETIEVTVGVQMALSMDQKNELKEMSLVRNLGLHNRWEIDSAYLRETIRTGMQLSSASSIMPPDSNVVLIQAARHSNELRNEVRETFRMLANADYQIARYYSLDNPAYRMEKFIKDAHLNLENAEPRLTKIIDAFELLESTAQSERALEECSR